MTMLAAALVSLTLLTPAASPAASAGQAIASAPTSKLPCRSVEDIWKVEKDAGGIVQELPEDLAKALAAIIWRSIGFAPPTVTSLLVVSRKDGTVALIPVVGTQVCLTALKTTNDKYLTFLDRLRKELPELR